MVKNIDIFAPEGIAFNLTSLFNKDEVKKYGNEDGEVIYEMPGDIPTEKMCKIWAMADKLEKGEVGQIKKLKDLICDMFLNNHTEEEVNKLREKLGINALTQIQVAIRQHILSAKGEEEKNTKAPEKK